MRLLINSLQSNKCQQKAEIIRYKKKIREYQLEYDEQKMTNEKNKKKEEEALVKINALESELMMNGAENRINLENRTAEALEILLQREKEKSAQLEALTKNIQGDGEKSLKQQLEVTEARYHALCSAYRRRLADLPEEIFNLEQERKKIEQEHENKLTLSNQKLSEAKSEEQAILNEMDKTGQGTNTNFKGI